MKRMQNDTLVALRNSQMALEVRLKEDAKTVAARVIERHAKKNEWPEEDMKEVLKSLGLIKK